MVQRPRAVIPVGAGIADDVELHCGQPPVAGRAQLHAHRHRVPCGGGGELLLARQLQLHAAPGLQDGESHDVFGQHLLLAAKTATDAFAEHAHAVFLQAEHAAQGVAGQVGRLRAGAHVQPPVIREPADGAMRLQMRVLDALGRVGAFIHLRRRREPGFHVADVAMHLRQDVALRVQDAGGNRLVVQHGRAGLPRLQRVAHGGPQLVGANAAAAAVVGGGLRVRQHGGDALTNEAQHRIQHAAVVGVIRCVFVPGGGEQRMRRILMRQHGDDAGHGERCGTVDPSDAGMGVGRAQQL